ncbi:MAG: aldo/keto reductase [Armatimonadota bacterium]|nr:aldo/keto reductase [bacterium]
MQYRSLGSSGIKASVVAVGAWAIGGWPWGGTNEQDAIDAIRTGLDTGCNFIDTAPAYGLGLSEEIVGRAIAGRRRDVVIATKCGLVWHTNKGQLAFEESGRSVYRYLGPESIRYEVDQSLKRLGTDYIDLYQTHWQDPTKPIEDTMGTLMDLKSQGKIKAIGVSNASVAQIEEYQDYGPVDTDQELYSMLDRQIEQSNISYCKEKDISVLAYSPLAMGLLTGKIGPDREFPPDDLRYNNPRFSVENRRKVSDMLDEFKSIAVKHNITLAQLVIAWTIAQPGVTHALVGARNRNQAIENTAAGNVTLTQEEISVISNSIRRYTASRTPVI